MIGGEALCQEIGVGYGIHVRGTERASIEVLDVVDLLTP